MREMRAVCQEPDLNRRRAALERLAAAADVPQLSPATLTQLARRLRDAGSPDSGVLLLRRAWQQYPADFWVNEDLGHLVQALKPPRWEEAVRHLTAAVALRPDSPGVHVNLGVALQVVGQLDEAIACYHRAVALAPSYATAHNNLGTALRARGQLDEAIACYRRTLELAPKYAMTHCNLGTALRDKGQLDEALACFRQAVALDPKYAVAHNNLGVVLHALGRMDEALASARRALELNPKYAQAHVTLGIALQGKGQGDEALACFRRALELDPNHPLANYNLGVVLLQKGRLDEALASARRAVELNPKFALAHNGLGNVLSVKGRVDEAIACWRRALEFDGQLAEAHCNLGLAFRDQGDFGAALASLRTGHELGFRRKNWPYPSEEWVKRCERDLQLDGLLAATLQGKARPAGAAECVELADFCADRKRPATAVRFFTEAFTSEPKLAADFRAGHRSRAATAAAQAGCGQGEAVAGLDAAERPRLRRQALEWLQADRALWTNQMKAGSPPARQTVATRMQEWLSDGNLAGVRDAPALRGLPAEERLLWQAFWADVAAVQTWAREAQEPPTSRPVPRPGK
jgi:tetratricopeptide (TPR) repeat protein